MTRKQLMLLAAAGSGALLLGAYGFQLMGYAPCKLCLWQRWPHAAAVLVGLMALLVSGRVLPALAFLGAGAAAATGVLGVYHTGVERGWFEGPDTCTSNPIGNLDPDQLLDQIMQAPLVRCDDIAWQFLGLSMASWNAIASFALMGLWIAAARRTS